jgi:hypothetical protein
MKIFLSYASEDIAFAKPLNDELAKYHEVWFAPNELKMGDSLMEKISEGLSKADFGVVILSEAYHPKKWTQEELRALYALQTKEKKMILPVWKDLTTEQVITMFPLLADKMAAHASEGISAIASKINIAVGTVDTMQSFSPIPSIKERARKVVTAMQTESNSTALLRSYDGVLFVYKAVIECCGSIERHVGEITKETGLFLKCTCSYGANFHATLTIDTALRVFAHLVYHSATNSAEGATLKFSTRKILPCGLGETSESNEKLSEMVLQPFFDADKQVFWRVQPNMATNEPLPEKMTLPTEELPEIMLELLLSRIEMAKAMQAVFGI